MNFEVARIRCRVAALLAIAGCDPGLAGYFGLFAPGGTPKPINRNNKGVEARHTHAFSPSGDSASLLDAG